MTNTSRRLTRALIRWWPSGRGIVVTDVDGNEFFDFSAGIAVTSTGHCHPDVVAAIQKQAAELIHMSGTDFYYENMITLAERLSKIAPMPGPHKIYYGNSGTEAVECALKLSRYHTKRQQIIAFLRRVPRTHHGLAFADRFEAAAAAPFRAACSGRHAHPLSRCISRMQRTAGCRELCALAALASLKTLFKTTLPPEEVAAIFVEPIQGEGGYVLAPNNFMQELRRICDKHGILLVVDEVQSGVARTGKWWAVEHTGVQPDIVIAAPRELLPACRWALSSAESRHHGLGPRIARFHFRRKPGLYCRGARDSRCHRAGTSAARMQPKSATT